MIIKVKKLHELAVIPKRNNPTDAGADLYAVEQIEIPPLSRAIVPTGISIEIPEGFYARIAPRSGLAAKQGIDVLAGVCDSSYRGEIKVVLFNSDRESPFNVTYGDKIAQLIIEQHFNFPFVESEELNDSDRGSNGFGSSGNR
jgi:dUTP pyrophosphatase